MNASQNPDTMSVIIAVSDLASYFEAARHQQRRIQTAMKGQRVWRKPTRERIFNEVHFYLICWARIARLAKFIAARTKFRKAGLVRRRYLTDLEQRREARDHLEHFEDRLPGGPKHGKLRVRGDLLNLLGDFLTYGGRKINIGPKSLALLKAMVNEFRMALLFDCVGELHKADPNRLTILLRRAAQDANLARVTKQFQRQAAGGLHSI